MKIMTVVAFLTLSFTSFSAVPELKCELFKNETLLIEMTKDIGADGFVVIDLGQYEEFAFAGFAQVGFPGTIIISPWTTTKTEPTTDSVVSRSGNLFTITCKILE